MQIYLNLLGVYLSAIWLPLAIFRSLSRGQSHLSDVNYCVVIRFQPDGHREPRNEVGSLSQPST